MDKISMALDDVVKAERKEAKKGGNIKNRGGARKGGKVDPSTAKLVQKLVKRALSQRSRAGNVSGRKPRRNGTVVKKIVNKVGGQRRNRNSRRDNLSLNQRSRKITRRSRDRPQTKTIVREIRYVREPAGRRPPPSRTVVIRRNRPSTRVVYVNSGNRNYGRRSDSFYEPRNYLRRY